MAVVQINRNPSRRELWIFGLILPVFAALVGAIFQWKVGATGAARVAWIGGGALAAIYLAIPVIRRPVYLAWMYATFPIGFVISHIVLAVAFYVAITLTGLVMRLLGQDPMTRRFDRSTKSYWVQHDPHHDIERYFRQY